MRIITGKYKGRSFDVPHSFKARPTTDFAKENIFNVVRQYIDFEDATALDLFSGTGSISLELLSRGCSKVISVEMDRDHHRFITQCLQKLGDSNCTPIRGDVFRFVKSCKLQFDFIFADPPYKLENLATLPNLILGSVSSPLEGTEGGFDNATHQLLKPEGIFVLEHGKDYDFSASPHFIDHRSYGSVNFTLFKKQSL